jgi:hypothetical protein
VGLCYMTASAVRASVPETASQMPLPGAAVHRCVRMLGAIGLILPRLLGIRLGPDPAGGRRARDHHDACDGDHAGDCWRRDGDDPASGGGFSLRSSPTAAGGWRRIAGRLISQCFTLARSEHRGRQARGWEFLKNQSSVLTRSSQKNLLVLPPSSSVSEGCPE